MHFLFLVRYTGKNFTYRGLAIRQPFTPSKPRLWAAIAAAAMVLTLLGAKGHRPRTDPSYNVTAASPHACAFFCCNSPWSLKQLGCFTIVTFRSWKKARKWCFSDANAYIKKCLLFMPLKAVQVSKPRWLLDPDCMSQMEWLSFQIQPRDLNVCKHCRHKRMTPVKQLDTMLDYTSRGERVRRLEFARTKCVDRSKWRPFCCDHLESSKKWASE